MQVFVLSFFRLPNVVRRPYLGEILERATAKQYHDGFKWEKNKLFPLKIANQLIFIYVSCDRIGFIQRLPQQWEQSPKWLREQYLERYFEYQVHNEFPQNKLKWVKKLKFEFLLQNFTEKVTKDHNVFRRQGKKINPDEVLQYIWWEIHKLLWLFSWEIVGVSQGGIGNSRVAFLWLVDVITCVTEEVFPLFPSPWSDHLSFPWKRGKWKWNDHFPDECTSVLWEMVGWVGAWPKNGSHHHIKRDFSSPSPSCPLWLVRVLYTLDFTPN